MMVAISPQWHFQVAKPLFPCGDGQLPGGMRCCQNRKVWLEEGNIRGLTLWGTQRASPWRDSRAEIVRLDMGLSWEKMPKRMSEAWLGPLASVKITQVCSR